MNGIFYCPRVFSCAAARMSELELEQQTNIKFLVELGKSGNEIREMLVQVYGDNAIKETAAYKWVRRFSEGRESVTNEERSGRPETSRTEENVTKIRHILRENLRLSVRSIAEQVNIDIERVRKILTEDIDIRKVCAKMVPKELAEEQKQRRVTICQHLLERQDDILMKYGSTNTTLKRSGIVHNRRLLHDQKIPSAQLMSQNNIAEFFFFYFVLEGLDSQPS